MTNGRSVRFSLAAVSMGLCAMFGGAVAEGQCQNQLEIDTCKLGCSATEAVCGGLCDAGNGVCWVGCESGFGLCEAGCFTCDGACEICCADPFGICNCDSCRDDCGDCHTGCDNARDDCHDGCQLDCDACILNCERDCESICRPFRKIGEYCIPLVDRCGDGLTCWWFPMPGESQPQCFPTENDSLFPESFCRSMHVPSIHNTAINDGTALSFGTGGASAVGVATALETGVIYGEEGSFGCYFTNCIGATIDVEVGVYASVGAFSAGYRGFQGEALMFVEEAGEGIVFAFAQFVTHNFEFLGVADILSIEASLAPITVGVLDCFTIVDTVGTWDPITETLNAVTNSPPLARCADRVLCADAALCTADASVDNGSADADGQPLTLAQAPPGPYAVGEHSVVLTVTDPDQSAAQCSAMITVNDCDAPVITCPESITIACEGPSGTRLDPGDASAVDCTTVTINDPGESLYAVGTTTVAYTATDATGNEASCETMVTVTDDDAPELGSVQARPNVLWPPNHQMEEVRLEVEVSDDCDPEVSCQIVAVTVEELNRPGNGGPHASSDFEIVEGTRVMLRAERFGNSDGRVYTIGFVCADDSGNAVTGSTTVLVPHDLGDVNSSRPKVAGRVRGVR